MPQKQPDSSQTRQDLLVINAEQAEVIAKQKKRIEALEEYLRLERHKRFGASSEKNPDQGEVFNKAELTACESDDESAIDVGAAAETIKAKSKPGRKPLSDKLPRVQVHIDQSDEEKVGAIDTFYTVVKEELDIIPPQVCILEYLQEKAVFADGCPSSNQNGNAAATPHSQVPGQCRFTGLHHGLQVYGWSAPVSPGGDTEALWR